MVWIVAVIAVIFISLGLLNGRRGAAQAGSAKAGAANGKEPITLNEAFDILSRPIDMGDAARRGGPAQYRRGLQTGLGAGLLAGALLMTAARWLPAGWGGSPVPSPNPGTTQTPSPSPSAIPTTGTTPTPPAPGPVTFVVASGDLPPDVAAKLKAAGLITAPAAFLDRISARGLDTALKAGTFQIPAGATLDQVIDALTA